MRRSSTRFAGKLAPLFPTLLSPAFALATGLGDKAVSLLYERVLRKEQLALWVDRCQAQIGDVLAVLTEAEVQQQRQRIDELNTQLAMAQAAADARESELSQGRVAAAAAASKLQEVEER